MYSYSGRSPSALRIFIITLIFMALACARFKHLRTTTLDADSTLVWGRCKKGKRRVQGARLPFAFYVPRISIPERPQPHRPARQDL